MRFIPAGAGNTTQGDAGTGLVAVHPRGCGEHIDMIYNIGIVRGSSPRVRGTRHSKATRKMMERFIPAGAGNTTLGNFGSVLLTVHPRGCGEHGRVVVRYPFFTGSSPRVRGTLLDRMFHFPLRRFIPAGAGNTRTPPRSIPETPVHPRGCGEHTSAILLIPSATGSSPRVRGTRVIPCRRVVGNWFIPAGAGNTTIMTIIPSANTVHPRGCGEHWAARISRSAFIGSSPRVRGTRIYRPGRAFYIRFIPAGAGNTTRRRCC